MIKRIMTTAILLMVGLALLATPAEARTTTPPYSVGDRFTQSIERGANCRVVEMLPPRQGMVQQFWINCKMKGYSTGISIGIDPGGNAWFWGDWTEPVR